MKMKTIIAGLLFIFLCPLSAFSADRQQIRVLILQDAPSFNIVTRGPYRIMDSAGAKTLSSGSMLNSAVTPSAGGIMIAGRNFKSGRILFLPDDEVSINGRRFRGELEFIKSPDGKFSLVNHVGLENYIKGILYHEVSHYWPMEALKAQAIVCRSYAVYQREMNKAKDYDVTSGIYSQVYGGKTSERYRTSIAVEKTRGLVLTYVGQDNNTQTLPAFFHATCAGHTQDASLLWDVDIPALKGVKCGYCEKSPHYRWHRVLPADDITARLNKAGYAVKDIKDIVICGRDDSGRISDIEIQGQEGTVVRIPANKLRIILDPNIIRSTNFTVSVEAGEAVFEGLGWGHGVGMCQWGAYFMAKEGRNYKEILEYYYPGSGLRNID